MTRRAVKGRPLEWLSDFTPEYVASPENDLSPYGRSGGNLWVRETWHTDEPDLQYARAIHEDFMSPSPIYYKADPDNDEAGCRWRPSIHMPRWASRISLRITGVRVERLHDISEEDAKREGIQSVTKDGALFKWGIPDLDGYPGADDNGWPWAEWEADPRAAFRKLWEKINGSESWSANPWVWGIEFRRLLVGELATEHFEDLQKYAATTGLDSKQIAHAMEVLQ
jgi:hypothetical protein